MVMETDGSEQIPVPFPGLHMGGCQNCGPFLGTLNNRCRIIIGTQKGTIILTTTHMMIADNMPRNPSKATILGRKGFRSAG